MLAEVATLDLQPSSITLISDRHNNTKHPRVNVEEPIEIVWQRSLKAT